MYWIMSSFGSRWLMVRCSPRGPAGLSSARARRAREDSPGAIWRTRTLVYLRRTTEYEKTNHAILGCDFVRRRNLFDYAHGFPFSGAESKEKGYADGDNVSAGESPGPVQLPMVVRGH